MGTVSSTATETEEVKRHSSASFENVWLKAEVSKDADGNKDEEFSPGISARNQNGLNYMDLDLDQGQPPPEWGFTQTRCGELLGWSGPEELSAYASITFQKVESPQGNSSYREE